MLQIPCIGRMNLYQGVAGSNPHPQLADLLPSFRPDLAILLGVFLIDFMGHIAIFGSDLADLEGN